MSSQKIFKAQLLFKQPNHFWTQILCSLSDAGESFPQQQQRWQKTFDDAASAADAAAASHEACFLCSPVSPPAIVLVQLVTSTLLPPSSLVLQSANSSYRTPARRVKCAAALEQLRFDGFAARNENAASRVGDQATSKAGGVHAHQLFTPFALCWILKICICIFA